MRRRRRRKGGIDCLVVRFAQKEEEEAKVK